MAICVATIIATVLFPINSTNGQEAGAIEITARQNDALDVWLDKLSKVEACKNKADKDNPYNCKIVDSNKRYSYSCLQFQADTFVEMSNKYGVHGSIYDCNTQKQIARAMILDNPNNWRHWYNSTKKIGVPPVISIN